MSRAKSAREVQEGGSYGGSEGGSSLKSAKPGGIFKVIFQGLFFRKKILEVLWGLKTYSEQKRFMGQDF